MTLRQMMKTVDTVQEAVAFKNKIFRKEGNCMNNVFKKIMSLMTGVSMLLSLTSVMAATDEYPCWLSLQIYEDKNYDNIFDIGENIQGLMVNFINEDNKKTSVEVDEYGNTYAELKAGEYRIQLELPEGYEFYYGILSDIRSGNNIESEFIEAGIIEFQYTAQQSMQAMETIVLAPLSDGYLGGIVWDDKNGNREMYVEGKEYEEFEEGESGIPGAIINIYDANGEMFESVVTDEDGMYGMEVMPYSEYTLEVILPEGYEEYDGVIGKDNERVVTSKSGDETMEDFFFIVKENSGGDDGGDDSGDNSSDKPFGDEDDDSSNKTPNGGNTSSDKIPDGDGTTPGTVPGGEDGGDGTTPGTVPGGEDGDGTTPGTVPGGEDDGDGTTPGTVPGGEEDGDGTTPGGDGGGVLKPKLNTTDHYSYIKGYPDGTIKPQDNISRQEVATILFRLLDDSVRDHYYSKEVTFDDMTLEMWSITAVSTMTKAGVIAGYEDATFRPANNITRAEFATLCARFDSGGSYTGEHMFPDIEGHWAAKYINLAASKGWIKGYEDGTFRPNAYITRAEAMTLMNNVLERIVADDGMLPDMITWPDNTPDKWYYKAVQEATNSHFYVREAGLEKWTVMREPRDWSTLEK